MKKVRQIYHFLGSVYFAIFLIASTALFVIVGTFLESTTDSHRYAAKYIYSNPLFMGLLWGFFINILISALRRWPFRWSHIPFLITHLGLLMILSGVLIKNYKGIQGSMGIVEGAGSQEIFLPDTYTLKVEQRNSEDFLEKKIDYYDLKRDFFGKHYLTSPSPHPDLTIKLLSYAPHSSEKKETWIKGKQGVIAGLAPFLAYDEEPLKPNEMYPLSTRVQFPQDPYHVWDIFALHTEQPEKVAEQIYLQRVEISISNAKNGKFILKIPLKEALKDMITFPEGKALFQLLFHYSSDQGFQHPFIAIDFTPLGKSTAEKILIPLTGSEALLSKNISSTHFGSPSLDIDLTCQPALLLLEDELHDVHFFTYGPYGQVQEESFRGGSVKTLISYDQGYGGYFVQTSLPLFNFSFSRKERETSDLHYLEEYLREAANSNASLSPPLTLWQKASKKANIDFAKSLTSYLKEWDHHQEWFYDSPQEIPNLLVMEQIDWSALPKREFKACYWNYQLISELEQQLQQGGDLIQILQNRKWPLLADLIALRKNDGPCTYEELPGLLTALSQQIYLVADQLPLPSELASKSHLFSAYLRMYGIHLRQIMPTPNDNEREIRLKKFAPGKVSDENIVLESPLTLKHQALVPLSKLEDNIPNIILEVAFKGMKEIISLSYDKFGKGLRWPIFKGQFVLRFQPKFEEIPYRVRLRDARQINYPDSPQPYSYESDIMISHLHTGETLKKTISMNRVHETWEGYRFYLANLSPGTETSVQHVQIVVNHDPAKYFLTYPGAIILSIGILLLFFFSKKMKK